jgi:hypothetical protein
MLFAFEARSSLDLTVPFALALVCVDQAAESLEVIIDAITLVARLTRIHWMTLLNAIVVVVAGSVRELI